VEGGPAAREQERLNETARAAVEFRNAAHSEVIDNLVAAARKQPGESGTCWMKRSPCCSQS